MGMTDKEEEKNSCTRKRIVSEAIVVKNFSEISNFKMVPCYVVIHF